MGPFGMQECDGGVLSSGSRAPIDCLEARLPSPGQRRSEVVNREGDVVDPLPACGKEAGHGAFRAPWSEQFEFGLPHREKRDFDSFTLDNFTAH